MRIEAEANLVNRLRSLCNTVKNRLWIASPFIGNWAAVRKILGKEWIDNNNVMVRLMTDISESRNLDPETIGYFNRRGEIKDLRGLHAKIYIVDDCAVLTSANLTNTAFSKRYEVGAFLTKNEAKSLVKIYNGWWENIAKEMPVDWVPKISRRRPTIEGEETSGERLPALWELPPDPGQPGGTLSPRFLDHESFLKTYCDFSKTYARIQRPRVWPDCPLYFEVDSFLNYLFHEAPGIPAQTYKSKRRRLLTKAKREKEITKYARRFRIWISKDGDTRWREASSKLIGKLLGSRNISRIDRDDVRQIVDQLNCMNSVPIAKKKFINPKNNSLIKIRRSWRNLFYGPGPLQARMSQCEHSLRYFGRSSVVLLTLLYI